MSSSAAAVLADELGYEVFAVPEGWGLDSVPVLTEIALRTTRIRVASGILSVWGRTPATLAMTAATLHQVSGGRSCWAWAPAPGRWPRGSTTSRSSTRPPAARHRDRGPRPAGRAARPAAPRCARPARPLRLGQPPAPEVPIWVAALGEHTTRVAAELGDGWIPALVARDRLPAWAARLSRLREDCHAARARPHGGGRADHRRGRGRRRGPGDRRHLHRLVPGRHGRHLPLVRVRPGLCRRGRGDPRREPAAQPAARDRPARRRGRPRPARRVRDRRPGPRAAPGLGPDAADIVTILLPPGLPWPTIEATLLAAAPDDQGTATGRGSRDRVQGGAVKR